ncbi:FUSC family protein [Ornithinicoccus halotolerans]|uniref:FUSC family protein n=1 Tax=Ornithinicoccus halotolerans TaxID=1748220 RepID=UPI0012979CC8|nr:hypothetical protein [Ornithinicoccus halotolerans]
MSASGAREESVRRAGRRFLRPILLDRRFALAVKAGVAAALAWKLGDILPPDWMAEYAYYAAMGAMSVIYPVVGDSFKEAMRATAAILIGTVLASLMQWFTWPNTFTVGLIVLLAALASNLRFLGAQRSWVPMAALFVLVFSGDPPRDYVLAYTSQVVLGAAVGLGVNYALVPSLNLTSLGAAIDNLREEVIRQLRQIQQVLEAEAAADDGTLAQAVEALELDRDALRDSLEEVRRSQRGNPRARRYLESRQRLRRHAEGLGRIAFLVQDVGVVLREFEVDRYHVLEGQLRERTGRAFGAIADLLEQPADETREAAEQAVLALMDGIEERTFEDRQGRYLAGVVGVSAQRCLQTFGTHLAPPGGRQ